MKVEQHIALLGMKVVDKVTGFRGVVASVSFDLYGCIQAVVTPACGKAGKQEDGRWFDVQRLTVTSKEPVMPVPSYEAVGAVADGRKGPAEKPARSY